MGCYVVCVAVGQLFVTAIVGAVCVALGDEASSVAVGELRDAFALGGLDKLILCVVLAYHRSKLVVAVCQLSYAVARGVVQVICTVGRVGTHLAEKLSGKIIGILRCIRFAAELNLCADISVRFEVERIAENTRFAEINTLIENRICGIIAAACDKAAVRFGCEVAVCVVGVAYGFAVLRDGCKAEKIVVG